MTQFVGGMLDGWNEPTSKEEEAALPSTLHPTVKLPYREVGGNYIRLAIIDKLDDPRKTNVGPYIRDTDGRYYHSTHRGIACAA